MKHTMLEKINEYIRYKNKLGIELSHEVYVLRSFGNFMDSHYPDQALTIERANEWVLASKKKSRITYAKKMGTIRPFSKYLAIEDTRTEFIPYGIYGTTKTRANPYIYSNSEITRLLTVDPYKEPHSLRLLTLRTIIGLLVCTGMRVGEVLALKRQHINRQEQTISIYNSKRKSLRVIPIGITVVNKLNKYESERNKKYADSQNESFFLSPSRSDKTYPYKQLQYIWTDLLARAEVGQDKDNKPRIHDLRHTFACNQIISAYKKKVDIDVTLYRLSTYMGHTHLDDTYWYLSAVPALLKICSERFENQFDRNNKEYDK
ncbi:MAG: tyrosine-type recombinase/integrase [Planctomycetia bacterium]|nr:tyrosine-type recombinase/integrase [Planctomycetia bacterium]